jgi:hypothetical protein
MYTPPPPPREISTKQTVSGSTVQTFAIIFRSGMIFLGKSFLLEACNGSVAQTKPTDSTGETATEYKSTVTPGTVFGPRKFLAI